MDQIWNGLLDLTSRFIIPDWGSLIALIPIAIVALIVLFFGWLVWRLTALGPRRRGKGRVRPAPPPGVHMPGPSFAPVFGAVGLFLVLLGLVWGGVIIFLGVVALILTLLYWGSEAMRDYDHTAPPSNLPAVVHGPPPPGVHMPGPSFRPLIVAIALAVIFYGLVFGGWLLAMGVIMLIISLVGWLRDARREFNLAVAADQTGHLEALPDPHVPTGTFVLFGTLFVLAIILNSGLIPSGAANGSTGGSPAPGASGAPAGSAGPGGSPAPGGSAPANQPPADVTVTAQDIKFDTATIAATADKPLTIAFVNKDDGIPHDIEIADAGGQIVFEGATIKGVSDTVYSVPPLKAGTYKFECKWHPTMVGALTAQ